MTVLRPGKNCWQLARADTFDLLIDGEEYFRAVRLAMRQAQERIVLIGWDFDARVEMYDTRQEVEGPLEIGEYLDWLVDRTPDLQIFILQWDIGAIKLAKRGKTLAKLAGWLAHPRVHFALDGAHPAGAAQHEKLVVVDNHTAFCGGIDITEDRWDTREHLDEQPQRAQPNGHDAGPWHDVSVQLTGDVAAGLSELAEQRWAHATGKDLPLVEGKGGLHPQETGASRNNRKEGSATLRGVTTAIARTRGQTDDHDAVREIEASYCDVIASAKRWIYIETQYLTSKRIARVIADRLKEEGGPEIILVLPASCDGWLEQQMMDTTRSRLVKALQAIDHEGRFRVYHPVTAKGADIYVHAKVLIADTRFLRAGSSNLSNRSMGFDSECDVCVDAHLADDPQETENAIMICRNDLLAEHLGCARNAIAKAIEASGSVIAAIDKCTGEGRRLRQYEHPDHNAVHKWLAQTDILDPEQADDEWPGITLS